MQLVRKLVVVAVAVVAALYIAASALLFVFQRDILFVPGRPAGTRDALYRVRTVTESDGTRVAIWEALPARASAPVMVFFYGNSGALSDFAKVGAAFHAEGYGIVLASYRGYSGNPGHPSETGLMQDARAILDSLPRGHGPVVLWGQSLGTGVAARMAAEGRGAMLILQSPYTSVADVAARRYPIFPVHWLMRDQFDTLSLVPKIHMPVLIMSGTVDRVVPHDMAMTLARRLGRQATFVAFFGEGHDLSESGIQAVAAKWLQDHTAARDGSR